jgi:hypothetical protein
LYSISMKRILRECSITILDGAWEIKNINADVWQFD